MSASLFHPVDFSGTNLKTKYESFIKKIFHRREKLILQDIQEITFK